MKTWRLNGEVSRHEKTKVTKRVSEGIGDNRKVKIVEEDVYVLIVQGTNGERARFTKDTAFDMTVGEDVVLRLESVQTKLRTKED